MHKIVSTHSIFAYMLFIKKGKK